MKLKLFLFLLLLISGKTFHAQEILQPFVEHYGDNLVLDNFPAISKDGSHYLVEYSQYSCCIVPEEILQAIDSKSGKVLDEILLSRSQEEEQFTVEQQKTISEKVQQLLDGDIYTSFVEIEKFKMVHHKEDKKMHVEMFTTSRIYKSEEIELPRIQSHGFCCNGGANINENCLLYQSINRVWIAIDHDVILIETGLAQVADGCDQGPFYQMISVSSD